jgi:hypothetical protein
VEVYSDPTVGSVETADYGQRRDYSTEGEIPLVLDGCSVGTILVQELLF